MPLLLPHLVWVGNRHQSAAYRGRWKPTWSAEAVWPVEVSFLLQPQGQQLKPHSWLEGVAFGSSCGLWSKYKLECGQVWAWADPTVPRAGLETFLEILEVFLMRHISWNSLCSRKTENWGHTKIVFLPRLSLSFFVLFCSFFISTLILIFYLIFPFLKLIFLSKFILFFPISTLVFCSVVLFSCFWFWIFSSLVYCVCYLWVCLLVWLLSSFVAPLFKILF